MKYITFSKKSLSLQVATASLWAKILPSEYVGYKSNGTKCTIFRAHNSSTPQQVKFIFICISKTFTIIRKLRCSALKWYLVMPIACKLACQQYCKRGNVKLWMGKSHLRWSTWFFFWNKGLTGQHWKCWIFTVSFFVLKTNRLQRMRCCWKGKHVGFPIWIWIHRICHVFQK